MTQPDTHPTTALPSAADDDQPLRLQLHGRVAVVALHRPAARNALSQALMRALTRCAQQLAERDDIDVVLLTGSGAWFTAGVDLKEPRDWADDSQPLVPRREISALGYRMCQAWESLPQISIVAIEGHAVGGGLALSLACDWRVLASDAFVSLPEIALGIPLTWGTLPRLTSLVGPARAKRLTILCERIGAAEALAMGLVDHVSAPGQALALAQGLAEQVLAKPAAAVRMSKESINAQANALHHLGSHMGHDQLALAAASTDSRAARSQALKPRR
jgi:enoyl-CoA hydratase/carnithine racemase